MQIIEMNISAPYGSIKYLKDTQARVIECECWDEYVNYYINYNGERPIGYYISVNGGLEGYVLPKMAEIHDLEYDNHKLSCVVYNYAGQATRKIACVVQ